MIATVVVYSIIGCILSYGLYKDVQAYGSGRICAACCYRLLSVGNSTIFVTAVPAGVGPNTYTPCACQALTCIKKHAKLACVPDKDDLVENIKANDINHLV